VADGRGAVFDVADVKALAVWLTERSGYTYRLPRAREWLRATGAVETAPVVERCEAAASALAPIVDNAAGLRDLDGAEWTVAADGAPVLALPDAVAPRICATDLDAATARLRLVREIP
jgi:hypothetical protein